MNFQCTQMNRILLLLVFSATLFSCDTTESKPDLSEYTFFKVGESVPDKGESFIIALKDSVDISLARKIISDPDNSPDKIVLAKIVRQDGNEDFLNIDLNSNTTWSWKIEVFMGFVSSSIEIYDGWPGYIEEDIDRWFNNTSDDPDSGIIGFWGYTVVEEIEPDQLN